MKIYTKTGDKGQTSLFDGTRVSKNNIRVNTYGTVDELNSILGIVIAFLRQTPSQTKIVNMVVCIQHDLFEIGAILANPNESVNEHIKMSLSKRVVSFENFIDALTTDMPELTHFILPGGSVTGSFLQFARAVSRRAEREVITLRKQESVDDTIIKYFNRLSDLLFTMGRYVNREKHEEEVKWERQLG